MLNFKILEQVDIASSDFFLEKVRNFTRKEHDESLDSFWVCYHDYLGDYNQSFKCALLDPVGEGGEINFSPNEYSVIELGKESQLLGGMVPDNEIEAWKMIWNLEDGGFIARGYTKDFVHYNKNKTIIYLFATKSTCEAV